MFTHEIVTKCHGGGAWLHQWPGFSTGGVSVSAAGGGLSRAFLPPSRRFRGSTVTSLNEPALPAVHASWRSIVGRSQPTCPKCPRQRLTFLRCGPSSRWLFAGLRPADRPHELLVDRRRTGDVLPRQRFEPFVDGRHADRPDTQRPLPGGEL